VLKFLDTHLKGKAAGTRWGAQSSSLRAGRCRLRRPVIRRAGWCLE